MATLEERVAELEKKVDAILVKLADQDPGWTDEYVDLTEVESGKGLTLVDWVKEKYGVDVSAVIKDWINEAITKIKKEVS